jgi:hypothetical protein
VCVLVDEAMQVTRAIVAAVLHAMQLANAARVIRKSTSAGLKRIDTGQEFAGSGGLHAFIIAMCGDDVERFLTTLHERCWLNGLGWMMVGAAGQYLDRSIVGNRATTAATRAGADASRGALLFGRRRRPCHLDSGRIRTQPELRGRWGEGREPIEQR